MGDKRSGYDRRQVLKYVLIGGVATAVVMPSKWVKPVVNAVIPPAHAAASAPATTKPSTSTSTTVTTAGPTTTIAGTTPKTATTAAKTALSQAEQQKICDGIQPNLSPQQAANNNLLVCNGNGYYYVVDTP